MEKRNEKVAEIGKEMITAQIPKSIMMDILEEIRNHEPTYIPELPELPELEELPELAEEREEITKDVHLDEGYLEFKEKIAKEGGSRYAWFYLWTSPYWRFWALHPDCTEPIPACRTTPYPCSSYGDIHWEYLAFDSQYCTFTTVMFNAKCVGCGVFHVCCDDSQFPRTSGWHYLYVADYPICDCVCQVYPFTDKWQAVVLDWSCNPSPCP
ncbi:MAG: hypothetical protein HXS46_07400 [Theionarchaea archaeon]|nr:MAG: hypothetical protein AYK18_01855 [Theionarchaea archaeon DG-70]MBU7010500.1 hypothetical protein [Theionarchaea archaeon]